MKLALERNLIRQRVRQITTIGTMTTTNHGNNNKNGKMKDCKSSKKNH